MSATEPLPQPPRHPEEPRDADERPLGLEGSNKPVPGPLDDPEARSQTPAPVRGKHVEPTPYRR